MSSRYRASEPEDGELVEDELPARPAAPPPRLIRPPRPPATTKRWTNPFDDPANGSGSDRDNDPGPSKPRPYSPTKRSHTIARISQFPEKQSSFPPITSQKDKDQRLPVPLGLPPKPGSGSGSGSPKKHAKLHENGSRGQEQGAGRNEADSRRNRENDRPRVKYDGEDYDPPTSSRGHWSPQAASHAYERDRRRSPPQSRYDDRYDDRYHYDERDRERARVDERDNRYGRERERDYGRDDRYSRPSHRDVDDRSWRGDDSGYSAEWGNYNSNRDTLVREPDRRTDRYQPPPDSPAPPRRKEYPKSPKRRSDVDAEVEGRRKAEAKPINGTTSEHGKFSGTERPPSPLEPPPSAPLAPSSATGEVDSSIDHDDQERSAPIRIMNRPTRKPTTENTPRPSPSVPPPPPDEEMPPPAISPPPPPPDTPPPPPVPLVEDMKMHSTDVSSPKGSIAATKTNPPLEAAKSASMLPLSPEPSPVPHAPNRNLLEPSTRVNTPTNKAENPYEPIKPVTKRFKQMSAEEEMSRLHMSFEGTATLTAYDLGAKLGEGTFGVVTKGVEIATKRAIALKKLITHNPRDGVSVTTVREIKILKSLNHPNVVPILNMVVQRKVPGDRSSRGDVFMVFPYMDHDLCGLLANKEFKISHSIAKLLMRQILEGMAYIHANNFIHRDIKTANILVDKHGQVMIADFGLARTWTHDAAMPAHLANEYTNMVVTRWYRAPELLLGDTHYGPAVDMWSLGCVLGEMYNRHPVLAGDSDRDQLIQIFSRCPLNHETFPGWDRLPGFPDAPNHPWDRTPLEMPILECAKKWHMDKGGADLLIKLLSLDPKKRITAHDALDHPWFWTSPLPADPKKTTINVESSHEMTTRKQEPVAPAPNALRSAIRPPQQQQSYHSGAPSRGPPPYNNGPNARPGQGPAYGLQGHHSQQQPQQGYNGYMPPNPIGYQQPPPGLVQGNNPYMPLAPQMQQGFGPGPAAGMGHDPMMGMGMGMGGPNTMGGGFDNGGSFGRQPQMQGGQMQMPSHRPPTFHNQSSMPSQGGRHGIPAAPFALVGSGGSGMGSSLPAPPFKLSGGLMGGGGGARNAGQYNGPGSMNMGGGGAGGGGFKRSYTVGAGAGGPGNGNGRGDEKRRKGEGGLPY